MVSRCNSSTNLVGLVAAHRLLVALNATREVLDERRARQTDGRVGALEEAREELVQVAAKDLLEVDGLGLYKDVSDGEANGNEDDRLPTGPGCSTGGHRCCSCRPERCGERTPCCSRSGPCTVQRFINIALMERQEDALTDEGSSWRFS